MDEEERDRAIAWTRERLAEMFIALDRIERDAPHAEIDVLLEVEELNALAISDCSWLGAAEQLGELAIEELRRAWCAGLAVDASVPAARGPYLMRLEQMLRQAADSTAHFDALCWHAAGFVDRGTAMPFELRAFVADLLRNKLSRPPRHGSPAVRDARDAILHALLHDIIERFHVTGTRGRGSTLRMSACDILAAAMPNRPRLPKSYSAIERILLKGNKSSGGHSA